MATQEELHRDALILTGKLTEDIELELLETPVTVRILAARQLSEELETLLATTVAQAIATLRAEPYGLTFTTIAQWLGVSKARAHQLAQPMQEDPNA